MVSDFNTFILNETNVRSTKKELRGILKRPERKRMRELLRGNVVTFKFRKKNGEVRKAHGTLIDKYLPKLRGGSPRPEKQMVYFDLDKNGWRSFRSFTFIKIIDVKSVDDYEDMVARKLHIKKKHEKKKLKEESEPDDKKVVNEPDEDKEKEDVEE